MRTTVLSALCFLGLLCDAAPTRAAEPERAADFIRVPQNVAYIPDVCYCVCNDQAKMRLELDIAYPSKGAGPYPTLLFFHGGGWVMGSRKNMTPYLLQAAQAGYVAVAVSYHLAPQQPFPAPVEDAKCAVRWLRANADKYGIDKERIGAVGFSAGGQLACLLGSTGENEFAKVGAHADQSSRVQAVVSWYGVTNLAETKNPLLAFSVGKYLAGPGNQDADAAKRASPLKYASKTTAPTFLIHGVADTLVPIAQSRDYADQLRKAGATVSLVEVPNANHNFGGDAEQEALLKMFRFLDVQLKTQAVAASTK